MPNHEIDLEDGEHVEVRHAKHGLKVYVWRKDDKTLRVTPIGPATPAWNITWDGAVKVKEATD